MEAVRLDFIPDFSSPSAVFAFSGWNDAGAAASTAIQFLEDAMQAKPLGHVDPEEFFDFTVQRPEVAFGESGAREIYWPTFDFSCGRIGSGCDLVTGTGPEPHLRWRTFAEQIIQLMRKLDVKRVVFLGAFLVDVLYSLPVQVTGFAKDPKLLERLNLTTSNYQGPTGVVGVLANCLQEEGFEVVSLWAGLPHYINTIPNPRGALALVQVVANYLALKIDVGSLSRAGAEYEQRVSSLVAADPDLSEYVKDLKRREFEQ